jgi:hypothetical protein
VGAVGLRADASTRPPRRSGCSSANHPESWRLVGPRNRESWIEAAVRGVLAAEIHDSVDPGVGGTSLDGLPDRPHIEQDSNGRRVSGWYDGSPGDGAGGVMVGSGDRCR